MAAVNRYRGMARPELDVAYNNRAVVPGWEGYLARWHAAGKATYGRVTSRDLRYGPGARQRLDLFLQDEDGGAPVVLFLHGGYWQWNDKEGQACVADGIRAIGLSAAIGEYTLAPAATMAQICQEAVDQVVFLSGELRRRGRDGKVIVCGISTGAHLMACSLHLDCVVGGLLISGIYDLEPIRLASLNDCIGMDWAQARAHSPLHQPPASMPALVLAHGERERPEIRRQSADYHAMLQSCCHDARLISVAGADHFSILDTLIDGRGPVAQALKALASSPSARTRTKFA